MYQCRVQSLSAREGVQYSRLPMVFSPRDWLFGVQTITLPQPNVPRWALNRTHLVMEKPTPESHSSNGCKVQGSRARKKKIFHLIITLLGSAMTSHQEHSSPLRVGDGLRLGSGWADQITSRVYAAFDMGPRPLKRRVCVSANKPPK